MRKKTLRDVKVKGKKVFVRVDFNVPIDAQGNVTDDTRIRAVLPTIEYLLVRGAAVILASHLGRPKGRRDERFSLRPVARKLGEILGREVHFSAEAVGPEAAAAAGALVPGAVLLLENVRFYPEEERNDPTFAARQAALADLYVNDAFGAAHRAHASTVGIATHLPAVAGFLMEKELETLGRLLADPERPFLAVIGGAKISDKIGVLEQLIEKADCLLIGGGMANTFLAAHGCDLQASLMEADKLDVARTLLEKAGPDGKVILPVDLVVAPDRERADERITVPVDRGVPVGWAAFDIGPETLRLFEEKLMSGRTVFWNGPVGLFEAPGFEGGTLGLARAIAAVTG
ncbi:MAG: phosphoglycerate kinase, partial [Candidatus Desulforudis sp.]|nr:phosphoglycerate kinase [Desulforudis sp.]